MDDTVEAVARAIFNASLKSVGRGVLWTACLSHQPDALHSQFVFILSPSHSNCRPQADLCHNKRYPSSEIRSR